MRAGDQHVDVCLHLKSWRILSSSAFHAFTQTLVFPPQRRIYAARQLHASYQLHVFNASGDHPACDRRCINKAELNQSWRLNLSLGLFFDAFMTVLPAPAEPNCSVSVDVCPLTFAPHAAAAHLGWICIQGSFQSAGTPSQRKSVTHRMYNLWP